MSSNLKVNSLVPATGTEIGIGTTGGTIDFRCAATFGGNVTIGGTLTYDEVINIDSIGIVTARTGIKVPDDQRIRLGGSNDLDIYHTTSGTSWIRHGNTAEYFVIEGNQMDFRSYTNSHYRVRMGTAVELRHNNIERLKTTSTGIDVSGDITIPDSIIHSGDSNTKIRFPSADTVSVETSGSQRLKIDSDGRIGIGGNGIGSGLGVYLQRSSPTTTNFYEASDGTKKMIAGVDSTNDYVKIGSLSNHRVGIVANNGEKLSITSAGLVGIGITNPISKIGVQGTGNGSTGSVNLGDTAAAASLFLKTHSGSSTGLALGGRNTGGQYIQGEYQNSTVVSVRDLSINPYGGGVGIGTLAPNFGANPGADTIVFGTSQTERLRIDSDGDLWHGLTPVTHHGNRHAFFHNSGDNYVSITSGTSNTAGIVFGDSAANTTANYESYIAHWNNNNSLYLYTGQGTKGLELKSGGDASIIDGNLLLASGHGVNFQASGTGSGTTVNSHVLDDYERGTFTPKIYYGTGTNEPSYSWRYGHYIKVGKQVTVWFNIGITGFSPSNTEQVHIANLPFQHNDPNSQWKYLNLMFGYSWASGWGFNSGSNNQMFIAIYDNESKARVVKHDGAHIYTNDVGSGQRFSSYFSYQTDS